MTSLEEQETIFVQIPSYRDPECHYTLRDLFLKARRPERIFVGVCWQYDPVLDSEFLKPQYPYPDQVRVVHYHLSQSMGSGWACNEANKLSQGEKYTLQVHAHMRFEQDWDDFLIQTIKQCHNPKAVLTYFPPPYLPPDHYVSEKRRNRRISINYLGKPNDPQIVHLNRNLIKADDPRHGIYPSPFVIFNFIFSYSALFKQLPFDPHIYFWGEEIAYAVRLWTHGYDIYQLPRPAAYHQWEKRKTPGMEKYLEWKNPKNAYTLKRVQHLLGMKESSDSDVLVQMDAYGLGSERPLEEFWRFCGIDVDQWKVKKHALQGFWDASFLTKYHPVQKNAKNSYIFVLLVSHRDSSCRHAVNDLFEKAANPERINVGICWVGNEVQGEEAPQIPYTYPLQVSEIKFALEQNKGIGWAKAAALGLRAGEGYVLEITPNTRFMPGWDAALLEMLDACAAEKTAIGAALAEEPEAAPHDAIPLGRIGIGQFAKPGDVSQFSLATRIIEQADDERSGLYETPLLSGQFLFAPAALFEEVPPDPYMTGQGYDLAYSARLWTHGWTLRQPDKAVAYAVPSQVEEPPVPDDAENPSAERIRHVLGLHFSEDEAALKELDSYGHGAKRDVDSFWQSIGVNVERHTISHDAYNGYWQKLPRSASPWGGLPRIFVQIASYRDPECQRTVRDLFEKAKHPERVFVGICWQYIKGEDAHCFEIITRPDQVRTVHFDARLSKGACWARAQTQTLWEGEEYTLQIDAHMRFEQAWDETLLAMHAECPSEKSVISTYPPAFIPPDKLEKGFVFSIGAMGFNGDNIFIMKGVSHSVNKMPAKPPVGAFIGAFFLFGPSSIIHDVPYDPYLYFFGEEISLSVRLWTQGYDVYYPNKPLAYHDWKRSKRKVTHFKDSKEWRAWDKISFQRVRHLLGQEESRNPAALENIAHYGLGQARTLKEYQTFCGVNFARKEIMDSAKKGIFPAPEGQGLTFSSANNGFSMQPQVTPTQVLTAVAQSRAGAQIITSDVPQMMKTSYGAVNMRRNPNAIKTFESAEAVVYDNFLPEDVYEKIYDYVVEMDYKHINTTGKISRVWNIDNGFPLRGMNDLYFRSKNHKTPKPEYDYPSGKPFDTFVDHINGINPEVKYMVGDGEKDWEHFSVSSWLYPPGTGLSLHNDGSGIYTGAYVYYLNPEWKLHWGGLLLMMGQDVNTLIEQRRTSEDGRAFFRRKWLHESGHNDLAMEAGYAQCIFPKRNRMVFITNNAYHMVTKVNPCAGDNVRMSLAGFFHREKKK